MHQLYLDDFSLSLPPAMLIKDHLVNQEKGEVENCLLFIRSTGKSAIIFSDWNLKKHSRDRLCKRIALE